MMPLKFNFQAMLTVLKAREIHWAAAAFTGLAIVLTITHGASRGGAFADPNNALSKWPGRIASLVGFAADDVSITGLELHQPEEIMSAIRVWPGAALIGFDTNAARATLEALPWVKSAAVTREYPNTMKIKVVERQPFALWQHLPDFDLVDQDGTIIGKPGYIVNGQLPIVTGEGANKAAAGLVNEISAIPGLSKRVSAAARVGERRWTLYLDNGVKLALPEKDEAEALKTAWNLEQSVGLFDKGISLVDFRVPGQMRIVPLPVAAAKPIKN